MNKIIIKNYNNYLNKATVSRLQKIFETNHQQIINTLGLLQKYPDTTYYLYPSVDIKLQETGEDAYAHTDIKKFKIYMVYNKDIDPTGPHEDVHLLTSKIGKPNYIISEGLAEYFEDYWKGEIDGKSKRLKHDDWVKYFLKSKKYISVSKLFDDKMFWKIDQRGTISYPEAGSFVKYLVDRFGILLILKAYSKLKRNLRNKEYNFRTFEAIFKSSVQEVEKDWLKSLE